MRSVGPYCYVYGVADQGWRDLPQCRAYPVREICGGGLYPHRSLAEEGFRHPLVYCDGLLNLITHVRNRVSAHPSVLGFK